MDRPRGHKHGRAGHLTCLPCGGMDEGEMSSSTLLLTVCGKQESWSWGHESWMTGRVPPLGSIVELTLVRGDQVSQPLSCESRRTGFAPYWLRHWMSQLGPCWRSSPWWCGCGRTVRMTGSAAGACEGARCTDRQLQELHDRRQQQDI